MKAATAGLLASLACALHVAYAQTTYDIADCADLQAIPEVVEATVLDFTQSPVGSWGQKCSRVHDYVCSVISVYAPCWGVHRPS